MEACRLGTALRALSKNLAASWLVDFTRFRVKGLGCVLPPLTNSWIITALNMTPNIDCYWEGAVPKV